MRYLVLILAATVLISAQKRHEPSLPPELNGTWVPIKQELGGNMLPPASYDKQKLVVLDSVYVFTAESMDKGILRIAGDKMDIYGKEGVNSGKHFTAIYKIENKQLSICYNLAGDAYPEAYDTKGKPLYFLCVFRKTDG